MEVKEGVSPRQIEELAEVLGRATPGSKLIAGGTDFIIKMRKLNTSCDLLIDLTNIRELNSVTEEGDCIRIGSGVTFSQIRQDTLLRAEANSLVMAASSMGSLQVRNRATIGGNIANSAPSADSLPPLLIRDANLILIDSQGEEYEKQLLDVVTGPETNALSCQEAIIGVKFPHQHPQGNSRWHSFFVKVGAKRSVTIAKINMALGFHYDRATTTITNTRIALGAVGKTARRFPSLETFLNGKSYSSELETDFAEKVSREVEDAIRGRASMPYKREAVKGLAIDALRGCIG